MKKTARCSLVFTINIEVSGPDASQELADRWKQEIEHRWNGPTVEMVRPIAEEYGLDLKKRNDREKADALARDFMAIAGIPAGQTRANCCNVRVQVNIRLGEGTPGFHQIKAVPEPPDGISEVRGSSNAFYRSLEGTWSSVKKGVADHEAGHLLAESDKRDEKILIDPESREKVYWDLGVHPGHEFDLMGKNVGVTWPMEGTFRNALEKAKWSSPEYADIACDCCPQYEPYSQKDDLWRDVHRWEDHLDYALEECSPNSLATALEYLRRIEAKLPDLSTELPWIEYNLLRMEVRKAIERGDPSGGQGAGQQTASMRPGQADSTGSAGAGACQPPPDNTGITVAIADTFGPQGLRVVPAPGVVIRVLDTRGREVASTTTGNEFEAGFIALAPGEYVLQLDILGYKSALPRECTSGYVRNFELYQGEHKRYAASVYSATIAANGQSVVPATGECIRER